MKQKIDKNNKLSKFVKDWKDNQGIESLTYDELSKEVKGKKSITSEKIDGELEGCEFDGKTAKFGSKDGRLRWNLPVLEEISFILKKNKIDNAIIMGEIAGVSSKGKPLHFNETMSIIRDPTEKEEKKINFFPFELAKLNSKEVSKTFDDYQENFKKIKSWFKNSRYVSPVNTKNNLAVAWEQYVKKEKNEGIVTRTADGKIFKAKIEFTFDLGVIAIQEGQGKNKGRMGALILGFFDGDNFYRVINLGVGFDDKDRKTWWDLANKNKVKREGRIVWIDPFKLDKVIEVKYERLNLHPVETYQFDKKNKEWKKVKDLFAATISKPDFVRERKDKTINKNDLRLTQIPNFIKELKKFKKKSYKNYERIIGIILKEARNEN